MEWGGVGRDKETSTGTGLLACPEEKDDWTSPQQVFAVCSLNFSGKKYQKKPLILLFPPDLQIVFPTVAPALVLDLHSHLES